MSKQFTITLVIEVPEVKTDVSHCVEEHGKPQEIVAVQGTILGDLKFGNILNLRKVAYPFDIPMLDRVKYLNHNIGHAITEMVYELLDKAR